MATPTATADRPTRPARPARRRRLAALALAAASMIAGLGLDATPASASPPTTATPVLAAGYDHHVRLYWAQPEIASPKVTSYTIKRTVLGSDVVQKTWSRTTTAPLVDTGLTPGVSYRYLIQAKNADGTSAWSETVGYTNPGRQELYRFGNDETTFVERQYQDLLGRQPSAFELATDVQALELGQKTGGQIIEELATNGTRVGQRHPIIRLYRAYFDRAPDHAGLDYWVKKRAAGTTTLDAISAKFAGSSEFQNTYGTLTHGQFLDLIYENLFDRAPDAAGKAYWVKKLEQGTSRGRVMVQFSESNEYRTKSLGVVEAADLLDDMLGGPSGPLTMSQWSRHLQGGGNQGDMGMALTLLNAY